MVWKHPDFPARGLGAMRIVEERTTMNAEGKKKAKGGKGEVQLFQPMTLRGVTMRNRI